MYVRNIVIIKNKVYIKEKRIILKKFIYIYIINPKTKMKKSERKKEK